MNISISQMSADFEQIRESLGIEKWLVFGGSWGSTLGLDYAERYAERCLGLIVRGIFLNTADEFDAVYARKSFANNPRRLQEYDTFFEGVAKYVNGPPLDPNTDSERLIRTYESRIIEGDRNAIWKFHVFENNLVEEDPLELLDPFNISDDEYPIAQSVAFFECRLFLRGTFEEPLDLLRRVSLLKSNENTVQTWVVQGTGDEVCPERFAKSLVDRLKEEGVLRKAYFVDAGHRASSDGVKDALKLCVEDFLFCQRS